MSNTGLYCKASHQGISGKEGEVKEKIIGKSSLVCPKCRQNLCRIQGKDSPIPYLKCLTHGRLKDIQNDIK